ncbi:MAG: hypothetical protein ABSF33_17535 [Acidimicrobiales bacterium]|jgi:Tfp pilus assembly protein PilV
MKSAKNSKRSRRWSLNPATARARASDRARGRETDEGITLLEVIVAFTILMVTMVPIGYLLDSTVAAASQARQKEAALQLADSWMEILSNSSPPQTAGALTSGWTTPAAPQGAQTPTSTLPGTTFTVQSEYTWQSDSDATGSSSDLCSDGEPPSPAHPGVIQLHVQVTWPGGALTDTTNIPYPIPGIQTDGFLSLLLTNSGQAGAFPYTNNTAPLRLAAIPVNIVDTATNASYTLNPDENGCLFAQLPPGPYTVTLEQPSTGQPSGFVYPGSPPFVTEAGSQTDTAAVTLNIAAEQTVQLSGTSNAFDEGITTAITYGGGSAVDGSVECPGTSSLTCLVTGDGTSGASAAWGGNSSPWSAVNLSNATHLNQVACTSASSPTCVGVGYQTTSGTDTGVIVTTTSTLQTTSTDVLPSGVADVTQVVCPSAVGCYALGTGTSGTPELLAGAPGADKWVRLTPASTTFNSLSSIACPTSTTCEVSGSAVIGTAPSAPVIIRLDGDPGALATNSAWTPTFTADGLPSTLKSVGEITCPDSTQCLAIGTGDSTSASDPTIFTTDPLSSLAGQASTWIDETFPTGTGSLTGISCTSIECVAIGTMPGTTPTAAVWTGSLAGSGSSDQWQQSTTIPSVNVLTAVACGDPPSQDTASCDIAAVANSTTGALIQGTLVQNGGWVWNTLSTPSNSGVQYFTGVACESPPSSSNSTCAAAGVTSGGPIIITSANGPSGTWTTATPSALPGATVTGIPLQTTPESQSNWTTSVAAGGTSNAVALPGNFYPYANGYSIAAGDCGAEAGYTGSQTSLSAPPGGVADATIPLGLLPLQVVNSSGAAIGGATLTLTAATTSCAADSYTLPPTDAAGITRTSVPYGIYTLTGTAGTTAIPVNPTGSTVTVSIQVGPSSVTVTTNTTVTSTQKTTSVAVTTYLPSPAPVPG